jgi:hypothetical protein
LDRGQSLLGDLLLLAHTIGGDERITGALPWPAFARRCNCSAASPESLGRAQGHFQEPAFARERRSEVSELEAAGSELRCRRRATAYQALGPRGRTYVENSRRVLFCDTRRVRDTIEAHARYRDTLGEAITEAFTDAAEATGLDFAIDCSANPTLLPPRPF